MIELDGMFGEGGGQILRTALALSSATQQAFRISNIRAGRSDPGMRAQHLHCVKTLQKLTDAQVEGGELGSTEVTFIPGPLKAKPLAIDIETAGSITLLLQAVLLPCCFADKPMKIEVIGGTDVPWATPIDSFREVIVPQLRRWADISVTVEKRGYVPKGGGKVVVRVKPRFTRETFASAPRLQLTEQYHLMHIKGISHASKSLEEARVAERQAHTAQQLLSKYHCPISIRSEYAETASPGSGITVWAVFSKNKEDIDVANPIILGGDALGEKGTPAESIGKSAAEKLISAIASKAAADEHLADNLIPWMGLFPGSAVRAEKITPHTTTNIYTTQKFLPVKFDVRENLITSRA